MRTPIKKLASGFLLLALLTPVHADWEGERAALARLQHELAALTPIIDEAEAQHDPHIREAVNYEKLRYELRLVIRGVEDARHRRIPPHVEPLDGEYLR